MGKQWKLRMWKLDHKEGWALNNWRFWTVVLEKTLESPLECKKIQPVNPKGNHSRIFIGRTHAEAKALYSGHLMWRADSLEKTLMLGKIEGGRRGCEDEMVGWFTNSMDMSLSKLQEMVKDREAWCDAFPGVAKSWTRQSNWTTTLSYS